YRLFEPIVANCIILSAMDFINGCMLEQVPNIQDMKLSDSASSWPYYLRSKTGSAHAYAFMIFPKEGGIDLSSYIQVIDDIALFINLANDVLSFYKEYLAGEQTNYIHNLAFVAQRTVSETLRDVVDETIRASLRVSKVLKNTDVRALAYWNRFVNGYLTFHFTETRYRLTELDLFLE
ncbi:terpenoid synthase, partial [Agrocybe pediades]